MRHLRIGGQIAHKCGGAVGIGMGWFPVGSADFPTFAKSLITLSSYGPFLGTNG
jgi:hypothetical protein